MANSETDFISEIRDAVETQLAPAFTIKHSDQFVVGISDCEFQTHQFGHWLIEAKFLRASINSKNEFQLKMTDKQRKFIRDFKKAGGRGGWMLCVRFDNRLSHCYVGIDQEMRTVPRDYQHLVRKHGQKWDAVEFFELLEAQHVIRSSAA